jgi:hypothetical protein
MTGPDADPPGVLGPMWLVEQVARIVDEHDACVPDKYCSAAEDLSAVWKQYQGKSEDE